MARYEGVSFMLGWLGATTFMSLVNGCSEDTESRLEKIQSHNREISAELGPQFEVQNLTLDDENNMFEFTTERGDIIEVCRGDYHVRQGVAEVSGELACTRAAELEPRPEN